MKSHRLFWSSLWLLGALPDFCTSSSSSSSNNRALRQEFVNAMEEAMGRKQNEETFLSRLAQLAIPANKVTTSTYDVFDHRNLEDYQNYAVNLTDYALKYVGCSNIKTWSDEMAEQNNYGTVLKTDRFVVLRLCPRDSCSNYNEYGCMEQYGDYLIPMETYLELMAETFFRQYQEYCETCYECMAALDYNNNNNNGNDDAVAGNDGNNNNNYYNNNNGGRLLNNYYNNNNNGDDAAGDDAAAAAGDDGGYYYNNNANYQGGGCEYYAVCKNYKDACQDYTNLGFDLEDYFNCKEFNIGDSVGYLGPHCRSDGKTIGMAIFSDQNCYQFSADLKDMSSYMSVSENELEAYYSSNCISCLASDGYTLEVDNNGDGYSDVSDICGELYGEAAKCNRYMGNMGQYASENQEKQEEIVCNFIENLITNSYNEDGEIYLKEEGWTSYVPDINKMEQWQKYTLSASVLLTVSLFFYACYLHREVTHRKFVWYPRKRQGYSTNQPGMEPTALGSRMHSGIIQGRSQSSGEFEMKNAGLFT